jgi:hypothetical protein
MSGSTILLTLTGLLVAIVAACKIDFGGNKIKEDFWMTGSRGWKVFPVLKDPKTGRETAISGNFFDPGLSKDQFIQVPSFQSILSPRMNPNG